MNLIHSILSLIMNLMMMGLLLLKAKLLAKRNLTLPLILILMLVLQNGMVPTPMLCCLA